MKLIFIREDNKSIISLSKNPCFHAHTKHIEINYHVMRDKLIEVDINKLVHCNTKNMVINILTNALSVKKHAHFHD